MPPASSADLAAADADRTSTRVLTRRAGAAGSLAAAAVAVSASPAGAVAEGAPLGESLGAYRTRQSRGKDKLLPRQDRHLVSRFSYGVTPQLAKQVRRAGGADAWFQKQLRAGGRKDRAAKKLRKWWPSLSRGPQELWTRQVRDIEPGGEVMRQYQRYVLLRRIHSRNQLHEVMTEFWENHFNVPTAGDAHFTHRVDYGDTIRKNALGSFERLLRKAVTHPAMLIYLNASESTKTHPNENLGRELLELHTVGLGNYTEKDVANSARILTGWSVDLFKTFAPVYNEEDHYTGPVKVMGFRHKNAKPNGKAVTKRYLRYLAHHPETAERIASKLVTKFVGDKGSRALVKRLARVYLKNDTQIVPVLEALVASKQFRRAVGDKVRDPGEDVVAAYRVLQVKVRRPKGTPSDTSGVMAIQRQAQMIGQAPFYWGSPDGQPIDNDAWSSPGRLLGSLRVHYGLASQNWPSSGASYRSQGSWLPSRRTRLDELVDHLAQRILHQHASRPLLKACCTVIGGSPGDIIDRDDPKLDWIMTRLIATVLDTPAFLSR